MNKTIDMETTKNSESFLSKYAVPLSILISAILLGGSWVYSAGLKSQRAAEKKESGENQQIVVSELEQRVLPTDGVELPVKWGDLGFRLAGVGAIDEDRFKDIYEQRGSFTDEYKKLLLGQDNGNIRITKENSGYLLNLLWALGLANKNEILEKGEMADPKYGGAGNFASTGGWTVAKGDPMNHYSKHILINLTAEQQNLVDKVSRGIYRPCCGNSVHFPDCNHGMAMLGLLQLMASQGMSEADMWKYALIVNSYWFPDNYLTIATYMEAKGVEWKDVDPREILGARYSSGQGYRNISSQVIRPKTQSNPPAGGGGCGVDNAPVRQPKQQSGCGV